MQVLNQFVNSTYTGTGAALVVTLGFKPKMLICFNVTDGDVVGLYIQGMADDTAIKIDTATAKVASGGVTLSASGFSLGTDAALNESAKVYAYLAI